MKHQYVIWFSNLCSYKKATEGRASIAAEKRKKKSGKK
jgi:hypothetical protein